jgi:hypothetical protein
LYFSCKNKKELAQARITKVVVQITKDPTKLVTHFSEFSVIFSQFTRISNLGLLLELPFCEKDPGKTGKVAM